VWVLNWIERTLGSILATAVIGHELPVAGCLRTGSNKHMADLVVIRL
jgi:hypothetical protein